MNEELQRIARHYLSMMKDLASKFGLKDWLDNLIEENKRGECSATEEETLMLSRLCDDERVNRDEVPKMLGLSYRFCFDNDIFDKIKKLHRQGIYSKLSVLLFKHKNKKIDK